APGAAAEPSPASMAPPHPAALVAADASTRVTTSRHRRSNEGARMAPRTSRRYATEELPTDLCVILAQVPVAGTSRQDAGRRAGTRRHTCTQASGLGGDGRAEVAPRTRGAPDADLLFEREVRRGDASDGHALLVAAREPQGFAGHAERAVLNGGRGDLAAREVEDDDARATVWEDL